VTAGGAKSDSASSIAILSDGTIQIAGCFSGTANFSSHLISPLPWMGDQCGFLASYSTEGILQQVVLTGLCDSGIRVHSSKMDSLLVGRTKNLQNRDEDVRCFGTSWSNFSEVCSGHGNCIDFDLCDCHKGYPLVENATSHRVMVSWKLVLLLALVMEGVFRIPVNASQVGMETTAQYHHAMELWLT